METISPTAYSMVTLYQYLFVIIFGLGTLILIAYKY